jgi:hypothetical protein
MKRCFVRTLLQVTVAFALVLLLSKISPEARAAEVSDNLHNVLQLYRSDINSIKVELINSIMRLSADDAKKFWPIYRDYENQLGKLAIARAELITQFARCQQDGTFDDAKAKDIAKRWFDGQRQRLDLLEKFHGKIQTALSPVQAGQFLQIENQIGLFVDVAIASEMPIVGGKGK